MDGLADLTPGAILFCIQEHHRPDMLLGHLW